MRTARLAGEKLGAQRNKSQVHVLVMLLYILLIFEPFTLYALQFATLNKSFFTSIKGF